MSILEATRLTVVRYDCPKSVTAKMANTHQDILKYFHVCFQHTTPQTNHFKRGMKLEARDTRNANCVCIATVIETKGPRVELRLDGADDKNDFWTMVDCKDLKPIGHQKSLGGILQPPYGKNFK